MKKFYTELVNWSHLFYPYARHYLNYHNLSFRTIISLLLIKLLGLL